MNNDELYRDIAAAFQEIDQTIQAEAPSVQSIETMLAHQKRQHRQRQKREFIQFLAVAASLVFLLIVLFMKTPVIFLVIQIGGLFAIPVKMWLESKPKHRGDACNG
ncbi:MAG: YxlC family protein [Bacillus sp. (in: firmicutes)]